MYLLSLIRSLGMLSAFPLTLLPGRNKKAERTKGFFLRQLGHLLRRPGAFRIPFTEGLAFSGNAFTPSFE
jgi:hypothetical protein